MLYDLKSQLSTFNSQLFAVGGYTPFQGSFDIMPFEMHNYNIKDFGADSSLENNAPYIQSAIDACSASGGGRVVIPTGRFVSGTIQLKSHVELYLESGAVLASSCNSEYFNSLDAYPQNFAVENEGWDYRHLIYAVGAEDVAITGLGRIEGAADHWFGESQFIGIIAWRHGRRGTKGREKGLLRPGILIAFVECKKIRVIDVTIEKATAWSCFFHGCDYVQVRGVCIRNDMTHLNTDGLDIDSCRYVTVSDCIIETGDDCIAVRGSAARLSDPTKKCEYITITNCVLAASADAIRVGVGYGGVRYLRASNLVVREAAYLVEFNTSYNGNGHCELEDINFSGISGTNLAGAFKLVTDKVKVSHVTMENIRAEVSAESVVASGEAGALSDVTLQGIDLYLKPFHMELADDVRKIRGEYILRCANVEDLRMEDVRCFMPDDLRPLWTGELSVD